MTPERLVREFVRFGGILRSDGLDVGPDRIADALRGLDSVGLRSRDGVYWTLRQTLVSRQDQLEAFDRAFATWLQPVPAGADPGRPPEPLRIVVAPALPPGGVPGTSEREPAAAEAGWSPDELLRRKDFGTLAPSELERLRALMRNLDGALPTRRTRRLRVSPRGSRLDLRRLAREALGTGGEPFERPLRARTLAPRRLVLLCDVSGSMEPYSRVVLLFAHALVVSGRRVEAFAFGTRLTRLTRDLRERDPGRALAAAAERVLDWSGGTRIGASLKQFNDDWGRRALSRGAILVIISDGWERENAQLVEREMARLARAAYAVVWVNPLKGRPGYQPLAAGMRAALPYVDRFVSARNMIDLEELAAVLRKIERRHAT